MPLSNETPGTVLIIDPHPARIRAATAALAPYRYLTAYDLANGAELIHDTHPDLVLVAEEAEGADLIPWIYDVTEHVEIPLIVLAAGWAFSEQRLRLLEAGAAYYEERQSYFLGALMTSALRRSRWSQSAKPVAPGGVARFGGLGIDYERRRVTVRNETVHLTPMEWRILTSVAAGRGNVVPYAEVIGQVWKEPAGHVDAWHPRVAQLRTVMRTMRGKLGTNTIQTVKTVGYRLAGV